MLAALALSARAQTANPILQEGHLWAFDGFALIPPPGDWASLSKTRSRAVFAQLPRVDGSTAVATALSEVFEPGFANPEQFLAHMRAQRGREAQRRYLIVRHDEELELGQRWCTRYRTTGGDQESFFSAAWFIEISGRSCWHAEARLIIDLTISRRTRADTEETQTGVADELFFAGLQLRPLETLDIDAQRLTAQAQGGNFAAAARLAAMLDQGQGVAMDSQQALYWYQYAAEGGEVDAQYNLGLFHLKGRSGRRDIEEGLRWLARAADQRDAQAQFNLGLLFFQGEVLQPDFDQAYYWFRVAAANGHERAKRYLRAPLPGTEEAPKPAEPTVEKTQ